MARNRPAEDALDAAQRHGSGLRALNEQLSILVDSLRDSRQRMAERARATAIAAAERSDAAAGSLVEDAELARRTIAAELSLAREAIAHREDENARLQERLAEIQAENRRLTDEFVAVREQTAELANLYVAVTRLHGMLGRRDVLAAIGDIVVNVVGAEELTVYELSEDGRRLAPVFSLGRNGDTLRDVPLGAGSIGRTARSGEPLLGDEKPAPEEAGLTACVPLTVGEKVTGVLATFRLLAHKPMLTSADAKFLDVLGRHAGLALHCSRLAGGNTVDLEEAR